MKNSDRTLAIGALLGFATIVAFWPAVSANFVTYDDPYYVWNNAQVRQGLSWSNVGWALTTFETGNGPCWHPLTWLSHMLVVQLFGLDPSLHHIVNIALHIANSVLLLMVLDRMTGAFWQSALVAALFALHPTHVESVAWVSERKDVLSTWFFLLMLLAYAKYAECRRRPEAAQSNRSRTGVGNEQSLPRDKAPGAGLTSTATGKWYLLTIVCYALGLMSKPMLVTAPFLLLLLDFWPLRRVVGINYQTSREEVGSPSRLAFRAEVIRPNVPLLLEKFPFFVLSAIVSGVTFCAMKGGGALDTLTNLSLGGRIENALVLCCRYLGKLVWPVNLSLTYPYPGRWPLVTVALATVLLLAISAVAILRWRNQPSLLVGWLWFLGSLVPVIGIVPAGTQDMADRYTYIPFIGLFIAAAWVDLKFITEHPWSRLLIWTPVLALLVILVVLTQNQTACWRDTRTLFQHAVDVTPDSALAQNNLGGCLLAAGESEAAKQHFAEAIRLKPDSRPALENLANIIGTAPEGWAESTALYQRALKIENAASIHQNFANLLFRKGDFDEGEAHLREALRLQPDNVQARFDLGLLKFQQHNYGVAEQELMRVIQIQTNFAPAQILLGQVLTEQQKWEQAIPYLQAGLEQIPAHIGGRKSLGIALVSQGRFAEALQELEIVVQASPDAKTHYNLALALHAAGRFDEALAHYRQAVQLEPEVPDYSNDLAWLLATCPRDDVRNGEEAVRLAEKVCRMRDQEARFWGTLDSSYAEAGRFEEAMSTAQKALDMAVAAGQKEVAEAAGKRLGLYRERKAYREM